MRVPFRATRRSTQESETSFGFSIIHNIEAISTRNGNKLPRAGLGMKVNTLCPRKFFARLLVLVMIVIRHVVSKTVRLAFTLGKSVLDGGHCGPSGRGTSDGDVPPFPQVGFTSCFPEQWAYSVAI
jgi:hypothetical protein